MDTDKEWTAEDDCDDGRVVVFVRGKPLCDDSRCRRKLM